jgi:hypothetical protein
VYLANELHSLSPVVRQVRAEDGKRIKPHGKVMEILAIAVGRFAYANAAAAPKHSIDCGNDPFRLVEIFALFQFGVERDEENDAEGIGPQVSAASRPNALRTHPGQLIEDIPRVLACRHGLPQRPNG